MGVERTHREIMIANVTAEVREWIAQSGGVTSELRLTKAWEDNQWVIKIQKLSPESTWHLGT